MKLVAKRFEPTELGEIVNKLIKLNLSRYCQRGPSQQMEGNLIDVVNLEKKMAKLSMPSTNHILF